MIESGIYTGTLRHRRFRPVAHEFTYSTFMALLDIDRIPELMGVSPFTSYNRFNWAAFVERDHFGDARVPMRERVARSAESRGIQLPDGPIYLLTHLRYLGYTFNPISLFYCCDGAGVVQKVLAEVNNTFGESHNYWLNSRHDICAKQMHVSPFMGMQMDYKFDLTPPAEALVAHMETVETAGGRLFDATLSLRRKPWSASAIHSALLAHPWMTAKVIGAIHWQALRLYLKKAPVFTHP